MESQSPWRRFDTELGGRELVLDSGIQIRIDMQAALNVVDDWQRLREIVDGDNSSTSLVAQ
jgi:hypothetical protein